jgi:hypothetical protein
MLRRTLTAIALACVLAGCARSPAALRADYDRSIRDAAVRTPASSVALRTIPPSHEHVQVANFTEWGAPGKTLSRYTWVSIADELQERCRGKKDAVLALEQILGLPPQPEPSQAGHAWAVATFAVPRAAMFRPCPGGIDVGASRCAASGPASNLDGETKTFLLNQLWTSARVGFTHRDAAGRDVRDEGYPFTGMGWTYDWDPTSADHVGVSEFVVRPGTEIAKAGLVTPARFCAAP